MLFKYRARWPLLRRASQGSRTTKRQRWVDAFLSFFAVGSAFAESLSGALALSASGGFSAEASVPALL